MNILWYKSAIIYALDVETFMDSDGDGIGDFQGLISRLDYLQTLGINCLQLSPFYPSPNRDNSYHVIDYYNVDPRLGTLGDFVAFMDETRKRNIRVVIDLVITHTAKQNIWFQKARKDKKSKYFSYFIWGSKQLDASQKSWTADEATGSRYRSRYYLEQPDLNLANPLVRDEFLKIMGFWLGLGVSGFRTKLMYGFAGQTQAESFQNENVLTLLTEMREFIASKDDETVLVIESSVVPADLQAFAGEGERAHLLQNFTLNEYLYLALARKNPEPLLRGWLQLPVIPRQCQWLNFLRNQDELPLDLLTTAEQKEIADAFGLTTDMLLGGNKIRRRLASLVDDRRKLELLHSLLFSLPGTPMLRYGDEINMGDDLSLEGKNSVRTVMQWANAPHAGFSEPSTRHLLYPSITKGWYDYKRVNVTKQEQDPDSFLNWVKKLIRKRKEYPEFRMGNFRIVETDNPFVFAHACEWHNQTVIALHNFSDMKCIVNLKERPKSLISLFSNHERYGTGKKLRNDFIELKPYGYSWLWVDNLHQEQQMESGKGMDRNIARKEEPQTNGK